MKPIEIILRDTNNNNLERALPVVQSQINYYRANNVDTQGISLMTVLDLLDEAYERDSLRKDGYILTLADFHSDATKFLKLSEENPIIYNTQLKRIYRSYQIFKDKYLHGLIFNHQAVEELSQQFAKTLLTAYAQLSTNTTALPKTLAEKITNALAAEANKFNADWLKSKLNLNTDREYTSKLSQRLLKMWQHDGLPEIIAKQLAHEKDQINNVNALTRYFHDQGLPEDAMEAITKKIIEDLMVDKQAGKLDHTALGALIAHSKTISLKKGDYNKISPILKNWHLGKVDDDVARQLEGYIQNAIEGLRENIITQMSKDFSELTVMQFLTAARTGNYKQELCDAIQSLTGDLAKGILLTQDPSNHAELAATLQLINQNAMSTLHEQWTQGQFTPEESTFASNNVFAAMDELVAKVQANIWMNQVNVDTADIRQENAALREEVAALREDKAKLATEVQELRSEFAAIKAMLEGKSSNPAAKDSKEEAQSSKGYGFFK